MSHCTCSPSCNTWGSAAGTRCYICGYTDSHHLCRAHSRLATLRSVLSARPMVSGVSPSCRWRSPPRQCTWGCSHLRGGSSARCKATTSETRLEPVLGEEYEREVHVTAAARAYHLKAPPDKSNIPTPTSRVCQDYGGDSSKLILWRQQMRRP